MLNVIFIAIVLLLTQAANARPMALQTIVAVDQIFVPRGFDDNDQVLAVVDGNLPNSCYQIGQTEVQFDQDQQKFVVTQYARRFKDWCLLTKVPFTSEVSLGVLPIGEYTVEALGAKTAGLSVTEAMHAGPDEHLYAAIDSARIDTYAAGNQVAVLTGRLTSTCMGIGEIKVVNSGSTIEVLPVMQMMRLDECHPAEIPFSWRAPIPAGLTGDRRLLHVRSLNGKAINVVFTQPGPPRNLPAN